VDLPHADGEGLHDAGGAGNQRVATKLLKIESVVVTAVD